MMPDGNRKSNIERFSGFADVYDAHRPKAPQQAVKIISTYLGRKPAKVVDIGCGTGLSTYSWLGYAGQIIGIEPNADMLAIARAKTGNAGNIGIGDGGAAGDRDRDGDNGGRGDGDGSDGAISFLAGYSNQLPFAAESVDVVTCSQSFHWMEPFSTLQEAARVLKAGGIFAAYDCDWPVCVGWELEMAYNHLIAKADHIIEQNVLEESQAVKWSKDKHLLNMQQSGVFRYTHEVVFHNMEACDAARYLGLVLSQGGIQAVFKLGTGVLDDDVADFAARVDKHFQGRTLELVISYRMRLGVK
jgi:ubiquinone/menaquinone biosynthesis C-methylase UbiE